MAVVERNVGGLVLINGGSHQVIRRIPNAGYKTRVLAFHPSDRRWLYTLSSTGWVYKIDLYNFQTVAKIQVGISSRSLALSPDGHYIMVGNHVPNSAVILAGDSLAPLKVIETVGIDPSGTVVKSGVGGVTAVGGEAVRPHSKRGGTGVVG